MGSSCRVLIASALAVVLTGAAIEGCGTSASNTGGVADAGGADADARAEAQADAVADANVVDVRAVADANVVDVQDAGTPDAGCSGVRCNGECLPATDCRSCPGATLLCPASGECVTTCTACREASDAGTFECFACDKNHQNPVGTCEPDDASYCLSGDYSSAYLDGGAGAQCDCSEGGTSSCPGGNQVCAVLGLSLLCFECGQMSAAPIDERSCQDGLRCNAAAQACQ
jgi:hypothetical protein